MKSKLVGEVNSISVILVDDLWVAVRGTSEKGEPFRFVLDPYTACRFAGRILESANTVFARYEKALGAMGEASKTGAKA